MFASKNQPAPRRILLTGFGELGSLVLDQLCRESRPGDHIRVIVRDVARATPRLNLARLCAFQAGVFPTVDCVQGDLFEPARISDLLDEFRPDLVFHSATIQSWWQAHEVPGVAGERLSHAHFGPWLPMHLTLAQQLMLAVRDAGLDPVVVNAAFPDAVNPVLASHGLAPTVGIGNASNAVSGLRIMAAEHLQLPIERTDVRFVAHHYVSHCASGKGSAGGAPYILRVLLDGEDVTAELPENPFEALRARYKRCGGRAGMAMTVSSAMAVLRAFLSEGPSGVLHAPGPQGLPGGYPVRVHGKAVELALPADVTREQAIQVNRGGQVFDGIEAIEPDGTVVFAAREMRFMREVLGYDVRRMTLHDSADLAAQLRQCFLGLRAAA